MSWQSRLRSIFQAIGAFQSKIILAVAYLVLTPVALYLRLKDPLRRRPGNNITGWIPRTVQPSGKSWFRRLF